MPAINNEPSPPISTDDTGPSQAATVQDSNSPSVFEEPTNR
jgi:hypothetical protein